MKTYRWATLGCGVIANELAQAMQKDGRTLYGVANRTYENAVAFAKSMKLKKFIRTYRIFLRMMMWILSIFPHRTIHIYNI